MNLPKLKIEDVTKTYGGTPVLESIRLLIPKGRLTVLFGASGSGKSTLLKIIAGIENADGGHIVLDGDEIRDKAAAQRGIGLVFQKPLLFPHLNVYDNIAFGLKMRGESKSVQALKIEKMLELLEMTSYKNAMPSTLSGGQQQRVALGRAMILEPKLLLLDEPFSGLDYQTREAFGSLLKRLQHETQLTMLFVTHDVDECLRLADQIAVLDAGEILQCEDALTVYHSPISERVGKLMGEGNWVEGECKGGVFHCTLGHLSPFECEDGRYKLFLRPQSLSLCEEQTGTPVKLRSVQQLGRIQRLYCDTMRESLMIDQLNIVQLQDQIYVRIIQNAHIQLRPTSVKNKLTHI